MTTNELSGTVLGPAVQAAAIHGDLHFHEVPDEPPPVPRQLPAPPPFFTGRSAELARLERLAGPVPRTIVISGPAGVGKTALALQWAYSAGDRFSDGHLYVDLRGFGGGDPVEPGEALGMFLRALGVPARRVPVTLAEQVQLYRSVTADRALLVVLDNAYSAAQVRVLVPASPHSVVLVTARTRLAGLAPEGVRLLEVAPLTADESMALLTRAVGGGRIGREMQRAEHLARLCDGLPIALCVAAGRLATRPKLSIDRLTAELAEEADRLRALSTVDGFSVRAGFDASYRSLAGAAARMYRLLSLHTGGDFGWGPPTALMPAIRAAAGGGSVEGVIEVLLDANLLQEVEEGRFKFHDLLRLHARDMAEADETADSRRAAVRAMAEWYLREAMAADETLTPYRRTLPYGFAAGAPPGTAAPGAGAPRADTPAPRADTPAPQRRADALRWLEYERVNLLAAGRAALEHGLAELAWHLSDVLWPLFLYRKHFRDWLDADRRGVAAARAWGNGWAEADMLKRLARVSTMLGDLDAAERYNLDAIERYREAGDVRGRLDAEENLATVYRDAGQVERAATIYARVLAANRQLGEPRSTALTLINFGNVLTRLGRPGDAIGPLTEAGELLEAMAPVDPHNRVRVLIGLARAHLGAGDLPSAERAAASAAVGMREQGAPYEEATALELLGTIAERQGDAYAARRHYRRALALYEAHGSDRVGAVAARLAELESEPASE